MKEQERLEIGNRAFGKTGLIITSDPQYPWTDRTDDRLPESEADRNRRSRELITAQYNDINDYRRQKYDGTRIPVIINGDVTAFGHGWQVDEMRRLFGILGSNYLLGLGNHDYENNVNDCWQNNCFRNSINLLRDSVSQFGSQVRLDFRSVSFPQSHLRTVTGSYSYAINYGQIRLVQLNNYPTYTTSIRYTTGITQVTYNITSSLNWLENELRGAYQEGKVIIINLHKPNAWDKGANTRFIELIERYDVKVVFAGHYHKNAGRFNAQNFFGRVPVYLSGSASQSTYLIMEIEGENMFIYLVRNNNWRSKTLIGEINIGHRSRLFYLYNGVFQGYNTAHEVVSFNCNLGTIRQNDTISSIVMPRNSTITVYVHVNFRGAHLTMFNSSNALRRINLASTWWNNRISSYRSSELNETSYLDGKQLRIATVVNGSFVISSQASSGPFDNVVIWRKDHGTRQRFRLRHAHEKGSNVYQIWDDLNQNIVAWNTSSTNGQQVFMHPNEDKDEHYWVFEELENAFYVISNYKDRNFVLNVSGSHVSNGTRIQVFSRNGTRAQQFEVDQCQ